MQPEAFTLRISDTAINDLRGRLFRTRLPDQAPGDPWEYGTSVDLPERADRILAQRL